MPIYAYRCEACGFAKDVLQKISDPQLTVCTSCGEPAFKKQVTAAGFQLKGSGWYVTDFRGGNAPATGTPPNTGSNSAPASGESKTPSSNTTSTSSEGSSGGSSNAASSDTKPTTKTE